jgi:hypothetical protein
MSFEYELRPTFARRVGELGERIEVGVSVDETEARCTTNDAIHRSLVGFGLPFFRR